jgi:TonB family protein
MNRTQVRTLFLAWSTAIVAALALLGSASADEKPPSEKSSVAGDSAETPSAPVEGTVIYSLLIGVDGLIKDAKLVTSSGSKKLDDAGREYVKTWRLTPGTTNGVPTEMWRSFKIAFKLAENSTAANADIAASIASKDRSKEDIEQDEWRKPQVVLEYLGVKPGMRALDYLAASGYYSELLSRIVGPKGEVIVYNNPRYANFVGDKLPQRFENNRLPNVQVVTLPTKELKLALNSLDVVLFVQSYHDLYWHPKDDPEPFGDPIKIAADIYRALKPGGIVVVLDHSAKAGQPPSNTVDVYHRIDPQVVKENFVSAGFIFDGENKALRHPKDSLTESVFNPSVRHKTDQFIFRFRKP